MKSAPWSIMIFWLVPLVALTASEAFAQEEVSIVAGRNNTLYESPTGALSNALGNHLFAGRTNQATNSRRRGLIWFDVAGSVPEGATIESAVLHMTMSMTIAGAQSISLHRVTASWGEGTSAASGGEGGGAPATDGDATWTHRFRPDTPWSSAGGDFVTTASASASVGGNGNYAWGSTPGIVADVQAWLDDPDANHGWLLHGNEASAPTSKRFQSRHHINENERPILVVTYSLETAEPPEAPVLLSPEDGETVELPPALVWGTSAGADTYDLQVAVDDVFDSLVIDETALTDTSFVAEGLESSTTYLWRVRAQNADGASDWSGPWSFTTAVDTPVEDDFAGTAGLELMQNYPNPITLSGESPATSIHFRLAQPDRVRLTVYDLLGRTVTVLMDGFANAGEHRLVWHAADHRGRTVAPGIYLYRIETSVAQRTRRMVVVVE